MKTKTIDVIETVGVKNGDDILYLVVEMEGNASPDMWLKNISVLPQKEIEDIKQNSEYPKTFRILG